MAKKRGSAMVGRAWSRLRLAMLWIRKGGAFKRGLIVHFRFLPRCLKSLKPDDRHADRLFYREREFSFEETPEFQFKTPSMRLPRIPCISTTPAVDSDDDDDDYYAFIKRGKESYISEAEAEEVYDATNIDAATDDEYDKEEEEKNNDHELEDEDIDSKAEEVIKKFYDQMKLQRQISLLQYNEMLQRGTS